MCGIVGGIAQRDVAPILLEGLRRLEYRGYDSAGMSVLSDGQQICRHRAKGKVALLEAMLEKQPLVGHLGVAHTRWATHGEPSVQNAHPHTCNNLVTIVHNGIIENHDALRKPQQDNGHKFTSQTDTEVVVHAIHDELEKNQTLLQAVKNTVDQLEGAYALGVVHANTPDTLVAARNGSPLVIGVGIGEHFIASDVYALLPVTQQFIFLEDGDIVELKRDSLTIYDKEFNIVERPVKESTLSGDAVERGEYRHYMMKEIFEQPRAIADTLEGRIANGKVLVNAFGAEAEKIFRDIKAIQIVACGTSYHAGLVAKYWFEGLTDLPCHIEVASEYRYRQHVVAPNTLFVTITQSGETADTLAALKLAKTLGYSASLVVCNVAESSLVRASDLALLTRAGPEIGVASTKAFTTQLTALLMLVIAVGRHSGLYEEMEAELIKELVELPKHIECTLKLDQEIKILSEDFADKHHSLFLGRGTQYPVAMEGALKLKEISYIHAEAYPAGELKHGPLALIDEQMPVIAVAPNNSLLEKLKSNLEEVRARGGQLYVFADEEAHVPEADQYKIVKIAGVSKSFATAPIIFTIPLQLLSYHVAVLKGTDVDQPRNLAKSVTVE